MSIRKWRKKPSEELIKLMEETVELRLYLVHERGPLSLTFRDEGNIKYDVTIGNNIQCSCGGGKKEHCVHTLFALNKIYHIPFNSPLILQLEYTDQELNTLLKSKNKKDDVDPLNKSRKKVKKKKVIKNNSNQMSLLEDIVCPICQEDMYNQDGLFFCNTCGHNFHKSCMKIFIKHKTETGAVVTCPMCRGKWEEKYYTEALITNNTLEKKKIHKNVTCSNCGRCNIRFERFHCLECENYELCIECYASDVHREKNHFFIVKKSEEEKWNGCEYNDSEKNFADIEEDKKNKNKFLCYVVKNINLSNYLTNCLPDYRSEAGFEVIGDNDNSNNTENNEMHIQNDLHNNPNVKCAVCKGKARLEYGRHNAVTIDLLMLKYIKNCKHVVHLKCCEKLFKILSYENRNKIIKVPKFFNKCRHDNLPIFKGLQSIDLQYIETTNGESKKNTIKRSNTPYNGIEGLYNMMPNSNQIRKTASSQNKRLIIQRIMLEAKQEQEQSMGFGLLNIQKINFDRQNDIQKYENNILKRPVLQKNKYIPHIPYNKAKNNLHPLKQETEVKKNNSKKNEDIKVNPLINAGSSLVVQKYNARPARYENNSGKVLLSPIFYNLNNNNK